MLSTHFHKIISSIKLYGNPFSRTALLHADRRTARCYMLTDGRIDEAYRGRFCKYANAPKKWPCHGQSLAFQRGVPGSIPNKSTLDLWWDKWHLDLSLSTWLDFPMSVPFQKCSTFIIQASTKNAVQSQRMTSSLTKIFLSRSHSISLSLSIRITAELL